MYVTKKHQKKTKPPHRASPAGLHSDGMTHGKNKDSCNKSSMEPIKKLHDKLGKVGKVNSKFVKFANFAMQIFLQWGPRKF